MSWRNSRGLSLLEVLLAIFILFSSLSAFLLLFDQSKKSQIIDEKDSQQVFILGELLEQLSQFPSERLPLAQKEICLKEYDNMLIEWGYNLKMPQTARENAKDCIFIKVDMVDNVKIISIKSGKEDGERMIKLVSAFRL